MAKKIFNRAELKAAAEAAEAKHMQTSRKKPADQLPVDPTFRVMKLEDGLINTYFSWCPAPRMPAVNPRSADPIACGQLHLRMQQLAGLRHLWDLVGKSGWMVMEAVWIDTSPQEQYLLFAAHLARGGAPGRAVVPIHLWQLWQPSYSPRFVWRPHEMPEPSAEMNAALEKTLAQHLAESAKSWVDRTHAANRTNIEYQMEALTQRIAELDEQRIRDRKSSRAGDPRIRNVREDLLDAEQQRAALFEVLTQLQPPVPPVIRQRLCQVQWFVQAPEYHPDPLNDLLEGQPY